ncbi:MAG: flagellar motor switch protein FliN [Leptospiraceae bacterium]|nr:flagellar motor switch protein FliN [Leptospiraceae bacterium]
MGAGEGQLSQEDIDALLGGGGSDEGDGGDPFGGLGDDSGGGDDSVGMPSDDILAAALGTGSTPPPPPPKPQGVKKSPGMGGNNANLNLLMDVTMALTVELGRKDMFIRDVLQLAEGSLVELDKTVGEELDLLVNGKLIGRGKLIIMDDYYGIRITHMLNVMERLI